IGSRVSESSDRQYYKQGINAQAEKNYEKAVEYFKKSLKNEEESPECLANLGLSLRKISENYLNEAFKHYKKALMINPKHEETLGYMGELYILQGNLLKANDILQQLNKLESDEAEVLKEKLDKVRAQLKKIAK
ncbi:tetratricopeptide repeat protein, partial [Fibrobacterota bacterium]